MPFRICRNARYVNSEFHCARPSGRHFLVKRRQTSRVGLVQTVSTDWKPSKAFMNNASSTFNSTRSNWWILLGFCPILRSRQKLLVMQRSVLF